MHDVENANCLLVKIKTCRNANFLFYVKFFFTGAGCTDQELAPAGTGTCDIASQVSEHVITGPVTKWWGCRHNAYVSGFKLQNNGQLLTFGKVVTCQATP